MTKTMDIRNALSDLLSYVDRQTCLHEETYRGGAIWTICRMCGRKWADDEGGFQPHEDAPAVARARAILAQPEPERAGEVEAWERRLRGRAGPFTAREGERYVEADVALEAFRFALAAKPQGEDEKAECPWGGCGECVGHEATPPAGEGARVTEADRELRERAGQMILRLGQFALIQRRRRYPKNAELAAECAELLAALAAREGGA